jgi:hypothetical protein
MATHTKLFLERADGSDPNRVGGLGCAWQDGNARGDAGEIDFGELRETAMRERAERDHKP